MPQLDDPLRVLTSYRMWRATSAALSKVNAVFAQFGLRRTTFATLAVVVERPGQRQGHVAEALAIDRPNFVQIVDELERAGLIARETAVDDKRAYALKPTEKGATLYENASRAVRECDLELVLGLSAHQLDVLNDAFEMITQNTKPQDRAATKVRAQTA